MILASIRDFRSYVTLHPLFPKLAAFLEQGDLASLPEGRTNLEGDDLFVLAMPAACTKPHADAPLEAHRHYIDVQVILAGMDTMGWGPLSECTQVSTPFDTERDIEFYANLPRSLVSVPEGCLAVFFPEDAHAPLIGDGRAVHKLVFKVRV